MLDRVRRRLLVVATISEGCQQCRRGRRRTL
jgi:pyruvate formate-lyase activating enzyme-like uncharacterized protein